MQTCFKWLEDMKKKEENEKMEDMQQHKVAQKKKSAEGSAGLLHKITKPTARRGGDLGERRRGCEVVGPL